MRMEKLHSFLSHTTKFVERIENWLLLDEEGYEHY